MKRLTFAIILASFTINGYTQCDFKNIEQKVEKYFKYSMELNKKPGENTRGSISKRESTHLEVSDHRVRIVFSLEDSTCFPKIISKIEHVIDTTHDPRVLTAAYRIYEEFIFCESINMKLKKQMITTTVDISEAFYENIFHDLWKLNSPNYFNKKAKNRIKKLLLADTLALKTKEIKANKLKAIQRLKIYRDTLPYFYKKYKSDSSDLTYHQWIDSTHNKKEFKAYKEDSTDMPYLQWKKQYHISKEKKKNYKYYKVSKGTKLSIISTIANTDLQEFAPELEKMYNNGRYQKRILLALAKFRYKDFVEKALNYIKEQVKKDKYKIKDYEKDLYYIGTQEAFAYFGEFLKTDMKKYCGDAYIGKDNNKNFGYYVLYSLSFKILNIPARNYVIEYINKLNRDRGVPYQPSYTYCDIIPHYPDNILDKMYQWIKENKGNYEIKEYEQML